MIQENKYNAGGKDRANDFVLAHFDVEVPQPFEEPYAAADSVVESGSRIGDFLDQCLFLIARRLRGILTAYFSNEGTL